jgi:steroid 5-alpha reductase family enzyme
MMPAYLLNAAAVVFIFMTAVFVLALILKNNGIVDVAWGLGFVLLAVHLHFQAPQRGQVEMIFLALVALWGLRLAGHILRRNLGKPEDFRYANMRNKWGRAAPVKAFLFIFMLQGFLMLIVSSPLLVVFRSPARPLNSLDLLGILVYAGGFLFETIADAHLAAHIRKRTVKGKLLTRGLWAFTRHPNYFGEVTLWWGLGLIALSSRHGAAGLVGPAVITLLIRYVSGVPLLEKKYAGRPDWEAYKKTTPIFIPRLPKSGGR